MIRVTVSTILASLVALTACSTSPAPNPSGPAEPFFATATDGIAYIDSLQACNGYQEHTILPLSEGADLRPTRTRTCIPDFPSRLMRRGFNAGCMAKFDLNPEGVPENIVTACNTYSFSGFDSDEIADAMFERLMQRAVSEMRYLPVSEERDGATRSNLRQPLKFTFPEYEHLITFPEIPNS